MTQVANDASHDQDYQGLRAKMMSLKQQHTVAVAQQKSKLDVSSLAGRCAQLEASNAALVAENQRLQEQLRANTERSTRVRRALERDAQKLKEEVESLRGAAAKVEECWATRQAEAQASSAAQCAELEANIVRAREQHAAELSQLQTAHDARLKDVEEWCTGEVDAVRHQAQQQVAQAHQEALSWQRKYDECSVELESLQQEHADLQRRHAQLEEEAGATSEQLHSAGRALKQLQAEREVEREQHERELRDLQRDHEQQLDATRRQHEDQLATIDRRLQGIVAKKDQTIAKLSQELQKTYLTLLPLRAVV